MTATRDRRDLEGITQTVIMLAIGGAAGAASFTHVHDVAQAHGQGGWLAWADAVVLELMSLASGLEIRRRHRASTSIRFPACVLACAVALSISAQVVEAESSVIGWIAAAVPALGFLVMVKIALARTSSVAVPGDVPAPAPSAGPRRKPQNVRDHLASPDRPSTREPQPAREKARAQSQRSSLPVALAISSSPSGGRQGTHPEEVSELFPAALAARDALAAQGQRLSRQTLTQKLRQEGHTVSSARGSALVKLLKTQT